MCIRDRLQSGHLCQLFTIITKEPTLRDVANQVPPATVKRCVKKMSEEGLKVLTRKRGGLKSAIVRIQSAVNSFDINLTTKHFLTVRLESLKSLASKYDEVQSEIELISKDASAAQADRVEVEEMIYSTEANILQLLDTFNTQTVPPVLSTPVHLKPISLPCFSGNILEWQHFYSIFNDLVHSRSDLTPVQKLHYLHSSVKCEPLDLIKSLPICQENYVIALNLLSERYNNPFILAKYYIQNLLPVSYTHLDVYKRQGCKGSCPIQ